MKKSNSLEVIFKIMGMIIGAAVISMLLLWGAYLLPVEPMIENVIDSESFLKSQDDMPDLLNFQFWKATDRGTNIIILHEIIYPNSSQAFQDALLSPTADYGAKWTADWAEVLMEYAKNRNYGDNDYVTYARYWHGYLIFLKPLFMLLNLQQIYFLNFIILLFLVIFIALLFRKRLGNYWIAYIFTILLMHPINIVQSFQLSSVFYAMNITLLLMLIRDKWNKRQILYLFVFDGILVVLFDFLTYPYVALGIPLLTYYLLNTEDNLKENIIIAIKNGIAFVVGYAGMWGMKWNLATLFTSENVIQNALESVLQRTGMTEGSADGYFTNIGVVEALELNLYSFFNEQNMKIAFVGFLVFLLCFFIKRKSIFIDVSTLIVCLLMAITPLVWIVVLKNHCSLHPHLEWRTLSVLAYAIVVFVVSMFSNPKDRVFCDFNSNYFLFFGDDFTNNYLEESTGF